MKQSVTLMSLQNQVNKIIHISICSSHHALSIYVKIFGKLYSIIRDIAIESKLCIEFGKTMFSFCV